MLITFVTAGYPSVEATPSLLLSLQEGGADIIELGIPFTDPLADGPTIQQANQVKPYQWSNRAGCSRKPS